MTQPSIVEVDACHQCPFMEDECGYCYHDEAPENSTPEDYGIIQEWCPLRKRPALVKIKDLAERSAEEGD